MKLVIVLSLIVCSYADKLDRTYLPPPGASTAGGSPGSLTAPGQESFGQRAPGFRGSQPNQPIGSSGFSQTPNQQSGPSGFGQARPNQSTGPSSFGQARPNQASGFGQPSGPNAAQGGSATGFGRPTGQANQASSFGQPAGTGVQPPFGQSQSQFGQNFAGQAQGNFGQQPERAQAAADRNAEILRYDNQNDGETFSYNFETSNGIAAEESGIATNGVQAQGGFSYTGDDGQFYKITYTADENGYVPQGDHLPTPPPIPDEILRSIDENARAAAAGTQEGAYNPDEDNSPQYNAPFNQGQNQQQFRGSTGFGPSGSPGQAPSGPQGGSASTFNQGSQGGQGFSQGPAQTAFNGNQGFTSQRGQGQNGAQGRGQGQDGYDYSRPQNQGRQPSGSPNAIPSGPSKALSSQNQGGSFPGQNQPSRTGPSPNQRQYLAPEPNQPQRPGSQTIGSRPLSYNQGSQAGARNQQPGTQGASQFNQNQGFGPSGSQPSRGPSSFGQNRPTNQPQGQQGFPGQSGQSQGQRGAQGPGPQGGEDGYEYNRPQNAFNSNQGPFRPQSQGSNGLRPQGQAGFPGSAQGQSRFPSAQGQSQTGFPGSQGQAQTGFPSPQGQSQNGFPGAQGQSQFSGSSSRPTQGSQGPTPQFPGPRGQAPQKPSNQRQETFGGPRQPPSFSSEEGYKY